MTLDEAIEDVKSVLRGCGHEEEREQLVEWLEELREWHELTKETEPTAHFQPKDLEAVESRMFQYMADAEIWNAQWVAEHESNARLRKLVAKAHACKTDEEYCESCYQDEGCCPIEREMQELGIEVEDA